MQVDVVKVETNQGSIMSLLRQKTPKKNEALIIKSSHMLHQCMTAAAAVVVFWRWFCLVLTPSGPCVARLGCADDA
jgi:hypothetical protein